MPSKTTITTPCSVVPRCYRRLNFQSLRWCDAPGFRTSGPAGAGRCVGGRHHKAGRRLDALRLRRAALVRAARRDRDHRGERRAGSSASGSSSTARSTPRRSTCAASASPAARRHVLRDDDLRQDASRSTRRTGAMLWGFMPPGYASLGRHGADHERDAGRRPEPALRLRGLAGREDPQAPRRERPRGGGWPVTITRSDAREDRLAAQLARGLVLATTGGYIGDAPPYQGHVVSIDARPAGSATSGTRSAPTAPG